MKARGDIDSKYLIKHAVGYHIVSHGNLEVWILRSEWNGKGKGRWRAKAKMQPSGNVSDAI